MDITGTYCGSNNHPIVQSHAVARLRLAPEADCDAEHDCDEQGNGDGEELGARTIEARLAEK